MQARPSGCSESCCPVSKREVRGVPSATPETGAREAEFVLDVGSAPQLRGVCKDPRPRSSFRGKRNNWLCSRSSNKLLASLVMVAACRCCSVAMNVVPVGGVAGLFEKMSDIGRIEEDPGAELDTGKLLQTRPSSNRIGRDIQDASDILDAH